MEALMELVRLIFEAESKNVEVSKGIEAVMGVAWYPCGFGSHRLAFKSQQAHYSILTQ